MQHLIALYKPVGLTPLEVINRFRLVNPEFAHEKIGYAGRLDPMAHGMLLLMIGEKTKQKDTYLSLTKTYEFEIVFGLQTDTYDLLGYLKKTNIKQPSQDVNIFVNSFVKAHVGKQLQSYPPYSSRTVNGKPLFWYAKNNKLSEITIPQHEIEIFDFVFLSAGEITLQKLQKQTLTAITSVTGDFRQNEIIKRWEELFMKNKLNTKLPTATFRVFCSSGTYVRELAQQMGEELGCGAIAVDILRTAIGTFSIDDAIRL